MYNGYNPGLSNYRQERTRSTQSKSKFSNRLGDCFHDGDKVLDTVSQWHDRAKQTLWRSSDAVTPEVIEIVTKYMLQEDSVDRLLPHPLSRKFERIPARANSNNKTLTYPATGTVIGGKLIDSPPLLQHSRDQSQGHTVPPPQWPSPLPSRVNNLAPGSDERNSGIFPAHRTDSPDMFSEYRDDWNAGNGFHSSGFVPNHHPRSVSQPQNSVNRPVVRPHSVFDNYMRQEESSFHENSDGQHALLGEMNSKGKFPEINESRGHITRGDRGSYGPIARIHEGRSSMPTIIQNIQSRQFDPVDIHQQPDVGSNDVAMKTQQQPILPFRKSTMTSVPDQQLSIPPTASAAAEAFTPSKSPKKQAKEQLPKLALSVALNWRNTKKFNDKLINRFKKRLLPALPGADLVYKIGMRDHVFVIDDAVSMRAHWAEMCELFGILAYIVKTHDNDGIDMYFTMSENRYNDKDTTRLVEIVENRKNMLRSASNINVRLNDVLGDYDRRLRNKSARLKSRSADAAQELLKPLSVYVFTNAVWNRESDPVLAITNTVKTLDELNFPASQVGIQFISFGDDLHCLQRLEHYDKGLGLNKDIVDHTPSNDSLWKMILGAIDPDADGDSEDEGPSTGKTNG